MTWWFSNCGACTNCGRGSSFDADLFILNHQDTLFDHLVLDPGQLLHHDVNETGDEAGQKANQTADHPTTDLQTTKTLKTPNRVKTREINKNKKRTQKQSAPPFSSSFFSPAIVTHHVTHPPLLLQKELVFNVIIVQTLEFKIITVKKNNKHTSSESGRAYLAKYEINTYMEINFSLWLHKT